MSEPLAVYIATWGHVIVCSAKLDESGRKVPINIDTWASHIADDWYDTIEGAIEDCERQRAKAISAAEKRLAKLRTMPIKVVPE